MPITLEYTGKLVLITGGGRGIGYAIAKALAQASADLAITYTSRDATPVAKQLSEDFGITVRAYKCDVTNSGEVDETVKQVQKDFGRDIDIGVANAGQALWKDAHENTDEEFEDLFKVNTFGPYYLSRALTRAWLKLPVTLDPDLPSTSDAVQKSKPQNLNKQILFVSSISALVAMSPQNQTAYNASKGAVTMMAKSLAAEWAPLGIYVNAISPGYVSTDMIANPPDEKAKGWVEEWQKRTPVGRFATADQIGEFVAVMLSDKQGGMGFMTGADVVVDGGYTLY